MRTSAHKASVSAPGWNGAKLGTHPEPVANTQWPGQHSLHPRSAERNTAEGMPQCGVYTTRHQTLHNAAAVEEARHRRPRHLQHPLQTHVHSTPIGAKCQTPLAWLGGLYE